MIPVSGTVEVRIELDGERRVIACPALAATEGDFLVAPIDMLNGWEGKRPATPCWASGLGDVLGFTPSPEHVPAAPGWWARVVVSDAETGEVETELHPVIAWRVGNADAGPIVLESFAERDRWDGISDRPGESVTGSRFDAVIFDPDHRPEPPALAGPVALSRSDGPAPDGRDE